MRFTSLFSLLVGATASCLLHAQTPVAEITTTGPVKVQPDAVAPVPNPTAPPKPKAYVDPGETDDDFIIQGEYVGKDKEGNRFGTQVIAMGEGKFEAVRYQGGLPGDGWDGDRKEITRVSGSREQGEMTVVFNGPKSRSEADGAKIFVTQMHKEPVMDLKRAYRESSTLNASPPDGAVVLFDGKGVNGFPKARVTPGGLLIEGCTSEEKFADCTIHLEFRLPYMPTARGQGRGNSGIYLQGRYEVQMLDSFGLEGKDNECGGIYKVAQPKVNMCFPPLSWQTYDIDFTAAKFDASGKKIANAKVSVKHNGVIIHENVEIPNTTGSAPIKDESAAPGPIFLQNHGNPVRYRNIWVVRK
ncbi:uncharacterized protein DUF1080 [Roseimicrobium gellanilyticum]|uniref:Uncharacterized protein DUF1080 n=1 Tax=Roseimicrobium gellanilyticum TaxID=748857 RepID=A0A366HTP0_9BACT|nr:DUF1080 domain-containing protein [Roseimicrobium gellanilyticum]RBP47651.1 uncharacterized protein DUF1080 [Roseimicrobium gellanilyticum]